MPLNDDTGADADLGSCRGGMGGWTAGDIDAARAVVCELLGEAGKERGAQVRLNAAQVILNMVADLERAKNAPPSVMTLTMTPELAAMLEKQARAAEGMPEDG